MYCFKLTHLFTPSTPLNLTVPLTTRAAKNAYVTVSFSAYVKKRRSA